MKKFFVMIFAIVALVSCSKKKLDTTPQMVTLSFERNIVSSNSMTRISGNEFLDIIEEQTSNYINVTLKNTDLNKTFTCKSNETITIPVGNYEIYGSYAGQYTQLSSSTPDVMFETPTLKCDSFVTTITPTTNTITLNVYYNCYAIFAFIDECKSCAETNYNTHMLYKKNKYYIGYFKKTNTIITLTPYDDSTEYISTTFKFSTTYDVNKVYAEFGKYYVIHPQKVSKTNCAFSVNLTDMVEGEI